MKLNFKNQVPSLILLLLVAITGAVLLLLNRNEVKTLAQVHQGQWSVVNSAVFNADFSTIDINESGDAVIVWQQSNGRDFDVYGQQVDSNGDRLGDVFKVNDFTIYDQKHPKVAVAPNGDYVVVWQSYLQDGSGTGIYGQKYRSNGQRWGNEFIVHTHRRDNQLRPDIAMGEGGIFVVTWVSEKQDISPKSIFAQFFDADGKKVGKYMKVNNTIAFTQTNPVVAMNSNSEAIVVWQGWQEGNWNIYAQLIDVGGEKLLDEDLMLNSGNFFDQVQPAISEMPNGDFVVAWSNESFDELFVSERKNIEGQLLTLNGVKKGTTLQISEPTHGHQILPVIASGDARTIVAWQATEDFEWKIYVQELDEAGQPTGVLQEIPADIVVEEDNRPQLLRMSAPKEEEKAEEKTSVRLSPSIGLFPNQNYVVVSTVLEPENQSKKITLDQFIKLEPAVSGAMPSEALEEAGTTTLQLTETATPQVLGAQSQTISLPAGDK